MECPSFETKEKEKSRNNPSLMAPRFHESETPHFFKVILKEDDDLQSRNLSIPQKFVREHKRDFTVRVRLEVAGGDTWDVKLFKQDVEFLLQDGWGDFMRHYDIKHGHFVIFRYEGESKFHVVKCGITACEINYPPKPTAQPGDYDTAVQELKIGAKLWPPVFRMVIQPSASTQSMTIPVSFMKEHLEQKVGRVKRVALDATLKVTMKSWPVTITSIAPEYNRYRMVKGWPEFARENEHQRGDVCVFTLVNMDWVFLVSIARKGQD